MPKITQLPAAETLAEDDLAPVVQQGTTRKATLRQFVQRVAASLPAAAQGALPIAFVMPGKPAPGAIFNVVMVTPCVLPSNLQGSQGYAGTGTSSVSGGAGGTYTVTKLAAADGSATPLGTASFAPGASRATLSQQGGASLAAGDVLQLAAPSAPDPALADVCITILAQKG